MIPCSRGGTVCACSLVPVAAFVEVIPLLHIIFFFVVLFRKLFFFVALVFGCCCCVKCVKIVELWVYICPVVCFIMCWFARTHVFHLFLPVLLSFSHIYAKSAVICRLFDSIWCERMRLQKFIVVSCFSFEVCCWHSLWVRVDVFHVLGGVGCKISRGQHPKCLR